MDNRLRPPSVDEVERIRAISDPVLRNLWITHCYHLLSASLANRLGPAANWCTFATWASKQAGQTIRKEDLARLLERRLLQSPAAVGASKAVAASIQVQRRDQAVIPQYGLINAQNFQPAVERASDAVARGNRKVFEEIGREFARFLQVCFPTGDLDPQQVEKFCTSLRPGDPPDGQGYLRRAFTHYAQSALEGDLKARAELILLANLEIGFHEQTRLQPEITESLDAGYTSFFEFVRAIFRQVYPFQGWLQLSRLYVSRWAGRPTELDLALQSLLAEVRSQLRQIITATMMTIRLPSGVVLRLGKDLEEGFPEHLQTITNTELSGFLSRHDRTPDSVKETGAVDWADLPERVHFILDLFRCFQENPALFDPPFTTEQLTALVDGRVPEGRL